MKPGLKGTYISYCSIYMPFIKCVIVEIENTVIVTKVRVWREQGGILSLVVYSWISLGGSDFAKLHNITETHIHKWVHK